MPKWFPDDQDRYILEYEMRHSYQTIAIGAPFKLVIITVKEEPQWDQPNKTPNSLYDLENDNVRFQQNAPSEEMKNSKMLLSNNELNLDAVIRQGPQLNSHDSIEQPILEEETPEIANLKANIVKWERTKHALNVSKLKKPRSGRRKELQHWVNLLISNLRKVNSEIDQQGEIIKDLFSEEDKAR